MREEIVGIGVIVGGVVMRIARDLITKVEG